MGLWGTIPTARTCEEEEDEEECDSPDGKVLEAVFPQRREFRRARDVGGGIRALPRRVSEMHRGSVVPSARGGRSEAAFLCDVFVEEFQVG